MMQWLRQKLGEQSTHTGMVMLAMMAFAAASWFKVNLELVETIITRGTSILIALGGLSAAIKIVLPEADKTTNVTMEKGSTMSMTSDKVSVSPASRQEKTP